MVMAVLHLGYVRILICVFGVPLNTNSRLRSSLRFANGRSKYVRRLMYPVIMCGSILSYELYDLRSMPE